jgi:hypothetical protein
MPLTMSVGDRGRYPDLDCYVTQVSLRFLNLWYLQNIGTF